jgi:hypothetical protein
MTLHAPYERKYQQSMKHYEGALRLLKVESKISKTSLLVKG